MFNKTEQEIMKHWKGNIANPIVSICTITYNHEKYIAEALDSFLMQKTDFPFEVVVDDDCSSDNTMEVIKKYIEKYPNIIRAKFKDKNVGMMVNLTENIQRAKGEYIALCEGDDYWINPEKLQIQINEMRKYPDINLSFHTADEVIGNKPSGVIIGFDTNKNKIFTDLEMFERIRGGFCPTASMIMHRKVMDPPPEFLKTSPVGDMFLQFLGSVDGGALFIDRKMSIYRRLHPESYTANKIKKARISVQSLIRLETNFTYKFIHSLEEMANIINQRYRKILDKRIAERLFILSILYLKNNMDKDFIKMIERSHKKNKSSFFYRILYYFRFFPSILRTLIKLREVLLRKLNK